MTTEVIITGSGTPIVQPERAGPGVLVRHGDTNMQFDAGRNTLARLSAVGVGATELTALFLTHYHSDHMVGLQDIVLTRWIQDMTANFGPLEIVAPNGPRSPAVSVVPMGCSIVGRSEDGETSHLDVRPWV